MVYHHNIAISYFAWRNMYPKTFEIFKSAANTVNNYFAFRDAREKNLFMNLVKEDLSLSILSTPLPYFEHEIRNRVVDVSSLLNKVPSHLFEKYGIIRIFTSTHAIEFISTKFSIPEHDLNTIVHILSNHLFNDEHIEFEPGIDIPILVGNLQISIFNTEKEIDEFIKQNETEKWKIISKQLAFVSIRDNVFNFLTEPWNKFFINCAVACLHPSSINHRISQENLGFFLALVHSFSKAYTIINSLESIVVSWEYESWFIEEIRMNMEKSIRWEKRNFTNLAPVLITRREEIIRPIKPILTYSRNKEIYHLFLFEYGGEKFFYLDQATGILEAKEKLKNLEFVHINVNPEEFYDQQEKRISTLYHFIFDVVQEYEKKFDSWVQLYNLRASYNLAVLAILISVISAIIALYSALG